MEQLRKMGAFPVPGQCLFVCVVCRIDLTPEDPQWVGAWWIGFLISGSLSFLIAVPLSAFPKSIPGIFSLQEDIFTLLLFLA